MNKIYKSACILVGVLMFCSCSKRVSAPLVLSENPPPSIMDIPSSMSLPGSDKPELKELPKAPTILASMRRTSCYGKCPVYEFRILEDGSVFYRGDAYAPRIGNFKGNISIENINKIIGYINQIHFFSLYKQYPPSGQVMDVFPKTIVSVKLDGQGKTITDIHNSPVELQRFERFLDEMLEGIKWSRVSS